MKARCLFRFSKCGKIYSSRSNIETGIIDCIDEKFFSHVLRPEIYNTLPPYREDQWSQYSMERCMYEDLNVYLTIDAPGSCFYAFKNNGSIYLVSEDLKERHIGFYQKGWYDLWTVIGYMPTKVRQFASRPYISELCYDICHGKVLLPISEFENKWFDIGELSNFSTPSDSFEGYKDAVNEEAYAVVYKENPMLVFIENDNLVLKKINGKEVM